MKTRLLLGKIFLNLYMIPIIYETLLHKSLMWTYKLLSMNTSKNFPEDSHATGQLFITSSGKSASRPRANDILKVLLQFKESITRFPVENITRSELHTVVTSPTLFPFKIVVVLSANRIGENKFDIHIWLPWGIPVIINLGT